ncbi:MAG: ATP-binding protein [Acidobacteria bacterium]|nr:ATP-binding protein [Acidobacteriota bacterium]MCI0623070.1 ATP-binding protein [Acidobacteriota bacterium]MCI0721836.1 ATP-binding protein [Acidobacteriota bacterium]
MTLRLKTRLTLAITTLVLVVLSIVSLFTIITFTREQIRATYEGGDLISKQVYDQVKQALLSEQTPPPTDPDPEATPNYIRDVLRQDQGLQALFESTTGYSQVIVYLAVTDPHDHVLAHSDSSQLGQTMPETENFLVLKNAGFLTQLRYLDGPPKNYEVTSEMVDSANRSFGTVRVAMNTALIKQELKQFLSKNLYIAGISLLLATTLAALFAQLLLSPLTFISAGIERLIQGEFGKPIDLKRRDEFGLVSLKLNEIGQRLEGSREELDALKGNFGQIVKSLEEKIIFLNPERRIVLMSPSSAQLLNTSVEASLGKRLDEVLNADHPLHGLVEMAFGVKQNLKKTGLQLPNQETRVTARVHYLEENNQPMGGLVIFEDPETVAKLENQFEYAKKLSALSKLTSGVAHEVKNPLNAIVIHLELLKSQVLSQRAEDATRSLDVITQEIKRLDRVVRNFLNFNRPVEVKLKEEAIQPVLQEVVALAQTEAQQHNVQISVQSDENLPPIQLDADLMKQCLLNIVLNGCEAMPKGGRLQISTALRNGSLLLSVQDEGVGIPPENREKVFNLYYTTKESGSGIGLATVFKVVQLHNGEIDVHSEVGKGTTFTLRFPVS